MSDQDLEKVDSGRRDFLKKSIVAGAVVWGAPAVTSLPGGRAWGQTYAACMCNGDAFGLRVIIPILGLDQTFGVDGSLVNTGTLGVPNTVTVAATLVTGTDGSSVDGTCFGRASIATLDVVVGPAALPALRVNVGVLTADATASCPPCNTQGTSSIANASASGTLLGGSIDLDAVATCNTDVLGLGIIVINEQSCDANGNLTVNALHITVPGIVEIIAAHAVAGAGDQAGGSNCPCTACA
ncbi:MAG: hypothetical protein ACRDKG_06930 [Actinomycetota bacterium]